MKLNVEIKNLRKHKGFSQTDWGELFGVTKSYISQLENGHKTPSKYLLFMMCYESYPESYVIIFKNIMNAQLQEFIKNKLKG